MHIKMIWGRFVRSTVLVDFRGTQKKTASKCRKTAKPRGVVTVDFRGLI